MRDRIFALLGVETGEESMVSMLLTQSVFLGVFFGAFDISAHSLFLSVFDEKMMARAYVVSGLAGIILTSLYTWMQTRMQFRNFAIVNLFAVTCFTLVLWTVLVISPAKWVVFFVFIMLGPLNILAMLGFWGTTGRLFSLRQGKRLFGLVDSGLVIGIIISCYTIPILLSFGFESHNILLISSLSVFLATVIQVVIARRFSLNTGKNENPATESTNTEDSSGKKNIINVFRHDRYTRTMAIFVALSVVTAFFVQYSFMAVTREQYPAEEDMAKFLGIFTGSMMIFTLLVKLLVFSYIIRNYGLKTCLAVSPVLIAGFTAIAILIGTTMGYSAESVNGFLIFFLLLALSRLFSKSLKDSIESPSFKVIYQTIDEKIRYEIQSGMDGTVNEIAALSSGLLLAGLGMLSFIKLIHFSIVLFFIICAWISVAFLLYSEYRKSIRKALETVNPVLEETSEEKSQDNRYAAEQAFRNDYYRLITCDYSSLDDPYRSKYLDCLIEYARSKNDINLIPVLKKISSDTRYNDEIRKRSSMVAEEIGKLIRSREIEKSAFAESILSGSRIPQSSEILRLLRDASVESRRIGLFTIGKFSLTEMLNEVCECLNVPSLQTDAESVLKSFGDKATGNLIRFYMASGNTSQGISALKLLGEIRSPESRSFLFSRLWANSRNVKELAVKCLMEADFKPAPEEKDKLHQLISEVIGLLTWNISAKVCLSKHNDQFLIEKLNRETLRWKTILFNLLSITYEKSSITKIRENLDNETVESENFALEMIDIVIEETIKPKLIALLDVVPDEDKLRNLYHFFPGEVPSYIQLHEDIINRDYNLISIWTKVCALRNMELIETETLAESAAALLFSPEYILQEEAARLISRSDNEQYMRVISRIPAFTRERLERILAGETDKRELLYEKTIFLSEHLKNIPEEDLLPLAGTMIFTGSLNDLTTVLPAGCIIWPLDGSDQVKDAFVTYDREREDLLNNFNEKIPYYILTFDSIGEYQSQYPERSSEILTYINKNEEQQV
jgi:ATP/ADP translocase